MYSRKIGIDARALLFLQRGMPLYVTMLCKLLPLRLNDIQFFLFINTTFEHNDDKEQYKYRLDEIGKLPNVTFVDIKSIGSVVWEQFLLPRALKKLNINILHMPTNRVSFFSQAKQIVTFHDAMELKFLNLFSSITKAKGLRSKFYQFRHKLYIWAIYRLGQYKVNRILTISEYAKSSLIKELGRKCSSAKVVYHGIPDGYTVQKKYSDYNCRKGILMLGGDSYHKNPQHAIEAWASLPQDLRTQHPLTIAGFKGNRDSPIVKTINSLNIEQEVIVKKWIDFEELVDLFCKSTILLFVSREEGFGFPLVQALACGTPVVCSTAEVLLELGGEAIKSADPENPKEISNQIRDVICSKEVWTRHHKLSINRAKKFSWDNFTDSIEELYRDILLGS